MASEMEMVNVPRLEKTKEALANFRELLTAADDLLTWKKEWFPAVVAGVVTVFFAVVWWNDVTVLTTCSVLAILAVLVDVACVHGRKFLAQFWPWTPARERQFTDICLCLSQGGPAFAGTVAKAAALRAASPWKFHLAAGTGLLVTAWIGNAVPNQLRCYWLVLGLALAPGVRKSGVVGKYAGDVVPLVRDLIAKYMPKKKPADAPKEE